ncbi:hypothetical protein ACWCPQ_12630, partial [Nocardia sp. NPDC001965]
MRTGDDTGADAILDTGTDALRYFEVFLPRYREWTGAAPAGGDYAGLAAAYDQQRGLDLARLRDFTTVLTEELTGRVEDEAGTQTLRFGEVPGLWSGSPAADNAQQLLADAGSKISAGLDSLGAVRTAATTAVEQIDTALRQKADAARTGFDPDTAGGKTAAQIDRFIDIARGQGDTAGDPVTEQLRTELPANYTGDPDPETVCRDWLDQVFVTEVDAKVTAFTTLCTEAHTTVSGAYEQLLTALDAVQTGTFFSPGGRLSADSDLTYTSGQPTYSAAVGTPIAAAAPGAEIPAAGTNPAAITQTPDTGSGTPSSLALTTTPASTGTPAST